VCGRFTQRLSSSEFASIFSARDLVDAAGERFNVAPTQSVVAVVRRDEERVLERFRWGLVPHWAKNPASGGRMINARAETVASTPAFRHSFRAKRCLVPADGFYEWQRSPDGRRPFYITREDGQPLAFAGLWSTWHDPATDLALLTCSIVTTTPSELMAPLHNRMPVILPDDA
jgi:putative SOS response-associated peptidase YedK